jgi:transposase
VELSRATLCGWVMRVGELLRPVSRAMAEELLGGDYLQADETPVGVQMHDGRGKNHQAYLWQYSRPSGVVIFDFQLGRGREGPKQFLGHFNGILQTDGYSGYDRVGGPKLIHAGCWAHARRYFFQAVEAHPDDRVAIALVATIDELFAIDAQARERNLTVTERIAAIISIVEICRRLKIPIRDYLAAILPGLADFPANRLHQLTPAAWCLETN